MIAMWVLFVDEGFFLWMGYFWSFRRELVIPFLDLIILNAYFKFNSLLFSPISSLLILRLFFLSDSHIKNPLFTESHALLILNKIFISC